MSKPKKRPDLTSLMGGAAKTSGATPKATEAPKPEVAPEAKPTPAPTPPPTVEEPPQAITPDKPRQAPRRPATARPARTVEKKPTISKKKKSEDYMMTSIAFDADDMLDLQDVAMCFMRESRSLKYPTRNMVAKVGIKAAHILSQEDPERLLELFEVIRSKDRRYADNKD